MFKTGLVVSVSAACALVGAVGVSAATTVRGSSSTPPCVPKVSTSGGHTSVAYCGPATATLKIGSKTFNFKNGYCRTDTKNHIALGLTLGAIESTKSPVNGGQPLFELTDITTSGLKIVNVNADSGGKTLDSIGSVTVKGSVPAGGTFTSSGFAKPSFTGSWNCHGVVVAQ